MDDVPGRIEHTVLGPATTWADVAACLDAAMREGMGARVPPTHVAAAAEYAPTVDLTTVVGFPHGQHATDTEVTEARTAWEDGADALALVPDHGRLLAGDDEAYADGIGEVVASVPIPVSVIVETGLFDADQIRRGAAAAVDADAGGLETSTGYVDEGATVAAVEALAGHLSVTASGGVGSWEDARALFEAGADRIASTEGDAILAEYREATGENARGGEDGSEGGSEDGSEGGSEDGSEGGSEDGSEDGSQGGGEGDDEDGAEPDRE